MNTPTLATSTKAFTPAGILGYAKAISTFVSGLLLVLTQFLPEDWRLPVAAVIAVAGFIATYSLPNQIQPVTVIDNTPGEHEVTS